MLHVGIKTLFDHGGDLAGRGIGPHHVHSVLVAASAPEVEFVAAVREPLGDPGFVAPASAAAEEKEAAEAAARRAEDPHPLVLPRLVVDLRHLARLHVEDVEAGLRHVLLARHLVPVALQLRTRVADRVHDPQVVHLAAVLAGEREVAGVVGPRRPGGLALLVFLFRLLVVLPAALRAPAEVLLTIGRELDLLDLDVLFRLFGLVTGLAAAGLDDPLVFLVAHHPEVELAAEDDPRSVRGHARPVRVAVRLLVVLEFAERSRGDVVLEVVDDVARPGPTRGALLLVLLVLLDIFVLLVLLHLLFLGRLHVELDGVGAGEADGADRQVLRVPRVPRDAGQLGGDLVVVEDLGLRALSRVHEVEVPAVRSLPLVPEAVGVLDPAGGDAQRVNEVADLVGGEAGGEFEVGGAGALDLDRALFLGGGGAVRGSEGQECQSEEAHGEPEREAGT